MRERPPRDNHAVTRTYSRLSQTQWMIRHFLRINSVETVVWCPGVYMKRNYRSQSVRGESALGCFPFWLIHDNLTLNHNTFATSTEPIRKSMSFNGHFN